jgi:hypothetical protein
LCCFKPVDQRVDSRSQRFYLAMLAKDNVAQLCIRTLEECDFYLDLLEGAVWHGFRPASVRR